MAHPTTSARPGEPARATRNRRRALPRSPATTSPAVSPGPPSSRRTRPGARQVLRWPDLQPGRRLWRLSLVGTGQAQGLGTAQRQHRQLVLGSQVPAHAVERRGHLTGHRHQVAPSGRPSRRPLPGGRELVRDGERGSVHECRAGERHLDRPGGVDAQVAGEDRPERLERPVLGTAAGQEVDRRAGLRGPHREPGAHRGPRSGPVARRPPRGQRRRARRGRAAVRRAVAPAPARGRLPLPAPAGPVAGGRRRAGAGPRRAPGPAARRRTRSRPAGR